MYPLVLPLDPSAPRHVAAMLAVATVTAGLLLLRRRWPAGLAAWVAYGVIVSPVLGLAQVGPQLAADRYAYLASLPWTALAAGVLHRALAAGRAVAAAATALLIALGALTMRQTRVWENTLTLWTHALALDPDNAFARLGLTTALDDRGRADEARVHYEALLAMAERRPDDGNTRILLSLAHGRRGLQALRVGDSEAARALFERSLEVNPRGIDVRTNLASLHLREGRLEEARREFEATLDIAPRHVPALSGLGVALLRLDRLADAEARLRAAVALAPSDPGVLTNLGVVLRRQGRIDEAVASWERALEADPWFENARRNLESTRPSG